MTQRWKELTQPTVLPVPIALAKKHCRVVDIVSSATQANAIFGDNDSQLFLVVNLSGSFGNQYEAEIVASGNNTPLSVALVDTTLTINLATNGGGTAISTVNEVIAALYADAQIARVFSATSGVGDGSGVVAAASKISFSAGLDSGDEDAYLELLIQAATQVIENRTGRAFINRNVRLFMDDFEELITLPITPVKEVLAINYVDDNGLTQSAATIFENDIEDPDFPARLRVKDGYTLPITDEVLNAVKIDFTAGFGDTPNEIPAKVKQCILFLVAHWYSCREPVINGISVLSNKVPYTFEATLNSIRLITI